MGKLKAGGLEIQTLLNNVSRLSNSVSITEKSLENKVSLCVGPVVQASVGEAKEQLKKLEQDYQRTYKKYREAQLHWYSCYLDEKGFKHHSRWAGYCITDCKNLMKELQNILDNLNIEEASQRTDKTPNHRKKLLMLHGCRNLSQEKIILKQKSEHIQLNNVKMSKKAIDSKAINREFRQIQRNIPRISSKKHVNNLLRELKETNRLREKATEGGAMVSSNTTSQDSIQTSTNSVTKLLATIIKELEKEKEKTDNILRDIRRLQQGYTENIKHLQDKKEWICEKWDDKRKYLLRLKNVDDGVEYFRPDSEKWRHEPFILPYFFMQ